MLQYNTKKNNTFNNNNNNNFPPKNFSLIFSLLNFPPTHQNIKTLKKKKLRKQNTFTICSNPKFLELYRSRPQLRKNTTDLSSTTADLTLTAAIHHRCLPIHRRRLPISPIFPGMKFLRNFFRVPLNQEFF